MGKIKQVVHNFKINYKRLWKKEVCRTFWYVYNDFIELMSDLWDLIYLLFAVIIVPILALFYLPFIWKTIEINNNNNNKRKTINGRY